MKISSNLRELRLGRNLTQEQVAEKLNVTRQTVSSYESGRTRPDIDTLVRYSEIYGVELESLIYGIDKSIKANRCVKLIAKILFVVLVLLVITGSASYLFANICFPLTDGFVGEPPSDWKVHWNLVKLWQVLDNLVYVVSFVGFLTLFIILVATKSKISVKTKLIYAGVLSLMLLIIPVICGIIDPVFSPQEYILTEVVVTFHLWVFLGVEELALVIKKRKQRL